MPQFDFGIDVADLSGLGEGIGALIESDLGARKQEQDLQIAQDLLQEDVDFMDMVNNKDLLRLVASNPQLGKSLMTMRQIKDTTVRDRAEAQATKNLNTLGNEAFTIRGLTNDDQTAALNRSAKEFLVKASQATDPEQKAFFQAMAENRLGQAKMEPAQRMADLDGEILDSDLGIKGIESLRKGSEPGEADEVQSSKILDDGTTVQVFKSGGTQVTGPDGAELTGASRAKAIKDAAEFGVDIQQRRSGARTSGAESSKLAAKTFKNLGPIRKNIRNLTKGIRLIDEGAKTGKVTSLFPSFKSSSIKLDQLRQDLGLDVIGAVTFGALSEGELQLALDTALPTGLDEKDLRVWMEDKRNAQNKYADYLEEVATFLDKPGNTIADWLEKESAQKQDLGLPKGTIDNGNGTFTLPDGQIVEPE